MENIASNRLDNTLLAELLDFVTSSPDLLLFLDIFIVSCSVVLDSEFDLGCALLLAVFCASSRLRRMIIRNCRSTRIRAAFGTGILRSR